MAEQHKVALLVTQNSTEISRPETLTFAEENPMASALSPSVQTRERRGSKSCLKVSDNSNDNACSSPRRRSVHFDASPASEVEVPNSEMDKAVRGCGTLTGPAPFSAGKEVYVAPSPDLEADMAAAEADEETQNLALAKAIARRQSNSSRCRSPPPPILLNSEST